MDALAARAPVGAALIGAMAAMGVILGFTARI